jgi:hypothetical protein
MLYLKKKNKTNCYKNINICKSMIFYIILYYFILFYIILYYFILFILYFILYYINVSKYENKNTVKIMFFDKKKYCND